MNLNLGRADRLILWMGLVLVAFRATGAVPEGTLEARLARVGLAQALLATKDWELQRYAQDILRERPMPEREALIPAMIEGLKAPDDNSRYGAVQALELMGAAVVPPLLELLEHPDAAVRERVMAALVHAGNHIPATAAPLLLKALHDSDHHVRGYAAQCLGGLGPAAHATLSLVEALKDGDPYVRAYVTEALGGMKDAAAIPALLGRLDDPAELPRVSAARVLGALGKGRPEVVTALAVHLAGAATNDRCHLLMALEALGPDTAPAAPAIVEVLRTDKDETTRYRASAAIAAIGERASGSIPALVALLPSPSGDQAAGALRGIGAPAVPALQAAAVAPDAATRRRALAALGAIKPLAPVSLRLLTAALDDKDAAVRAATMGALGEIGPEARDAAPALKRHLGDDDAYVRERAAQALERILVAEAREIIEGFRREEEERTRREALAADAKLYTEEEVKAPLPPTRLTPEPRPLSQDLWFDLGRGRYRATVHEAMEENWLAIYRREGSGFRRLLAQRVGYGRTGYTFEPFRYSGDDFLHIGIDVMAAARALTTDAVFHVTADGRLEELGVELAGGLTETDCAAHAPSIGLGDGDGDIQAAQVEFEDDDIRFSFALWGPYDAPNFPSKGGGSGTLKIVANPGDAAIGYHLVVASCTMSP